MKILWLSHNLPYPPKGGVLQRNYNLIRKVASVHNVHLIAFNQRAHNDTQEKIKIAIAAFQEICASVRVVQIPSDVSKYAWIKLVVSSLFTKDPYAINWLKCQKMREIVC